MFIQVYLCFNLSSFDQKTKSKMSLSVTSSCQKLLVQKANAWDKYANEMSRKLTEMIPRKNVGGFGYQYRDNIDLDRLDLEKLNEIRDYARVLFADKLLYTNEWTQEKLINLERRITTQIEVFSHKKRVYELLFRNFQINVSRS